MTDATRYPIWPNILLTIGIAMLFLAAVCVVIVWHGTGSLGDPDQDVVHEAMFRSVTFSGFVAPLAVFGGLLVVIGLMTKKREQKTVVENTEACKNCGRKNAVTTKICPRCETKLV